MSSKERCYIKLEFPCINTIEFNNNHADVVKKLQSECLYMYGYEYHKYKLNPYYKQTPIY